jgi:hypothetical protein
MLDDNEFVLELPDNIIEYIINNFIHGNNEEIDDEQFYISSNLANIIYQ